MMSQSLMMSLFPPGQDLGADGGDGGAEPEAASGRGEEAADPER